MSVSMEKSAFSYRFGTAEFDEARFELRVAGLPVEVERRALEVLAYLLRHAGEVVTKDELLREVWAGRVTVDKVLPNAINKLRRALGESNAGHIATQARVGYRLEGPVTRTAVGRQFASPLALAAGQPVPGRANFALVRQLGRTGGSEVWLGEHPKTREQRVYKFALDTTRLRALKREVTLLRLLQEGLDDPGRVVEVLDWNFEVAPFFLECRYGGATLGDWAEAHLARLDPGARLALFLQIADAVAAAHAVGVLHKDLKPANVLVDGDPARPQVRLTDFGSGHLMEADRLEQLGITRLGMTVEEGAIGDNATTGTPLYVAPELFAGHVPTVRSDVYALGVLLYQLLSGRVGQPMAPGWESEIEDELLREDLRLATDGNPLRRLAGADELADRLRRLEARRAALRASRDAEDALKRDRETLARAQARRPIARALIAVLVLGVAVAVWLQQEAVQARNAARTELERATALTRFLTEDLIGRTNPLVSAKGAETTLREVLQSARDRVPKRFGAQSETEAAIHESLASLFSAIDQFPDAEKEARAALLLMERDGEADGRQGLQARAVLVRVLSKLGRRDEAQKELERLQALSAPLLATDAQARRRLAMAEGTLLVDRNEFARAVPVLRAAVEGEDARDPAATAQRDVLRLDLIFSLAMAGKDEEAREEGRRLIEEARGRKEDNELLIAMTRLALARAQGENHAAVEALLLQAQPVIVARLGENHSRHITLLNELMAVAFRRADWPRAIEYGEKVYLRARAKLGDAHPVTYVTMLNWARAQNEAGQAAQALDKARQAQQQLARLAGPKAPQTQDATFVLALVELQLHHTARAQALIDQLDAEVLEATRATGAWGAGIDALRGVALQQRGDTVAARRVLDTALAAIAEDEESLDQPGRIYLVAKAARDQLR
ncbi:winged helix-turn-helix domain-containing protein [Mitsuaria sp. GD03876]|uniref:protein kinase domain-containing protein n=1 Tax=Mitsuaria sp. GD03876 TaxID=2975399 RepID=UPI002448B2AA|nr:winged helix-turn-helix domain-containing protein [Mitsuaria sp. GD03876]MDH0863868.1 winged helix-turn-helix domain-containing protein [Mitsuaria sp. GD03876]